jgi:prevent-host-death family protein
MAKTVNMHEAKTHLSKLVQEAAAGQEIVIARAGDPVAKLVPYTRPATPRVPGGWEGKVWMAPDFDELPPDLVAAFYGEED